MGVQPTGRAGMVHRDEVRGEAWSAFLRHHVGRPIVVHDDEVMLPVSALHAAPGLVVWRHLGGFRWLLPQNSLEFE